METIKSEATTSSLDIREYSWDEAQELLGTQWHRMLASGDYNLSMAPEWITAIATVRDFVSSLRVLVASREEEVVGILPFLCNWTTMFGVPVQVINLAGNVMSYHQEILASGCHVEILRYLLTETNRDWHVFRGENLQTTGPTAAAIKAISNELGSGLLSYRSESSPYLTISKSWDEFLKSKSNNFRYNLKRKEKALRKKGELEECWYGSPESVNELLQHMVEIESKSWKVSAGVAISSEEEKLYYTRLLPFLARQDALLALVLFVDQQPVAYFLCYYWNGTVGNLKTTFDENFAQNASPGAVAIHFAIRRAFEIGAKELDFLGDTQPHKRLWSTGVRDHENFFLYSRRLRSRALFPIKRLWQQFRQSEHRHIVQRGKDRSKAT